MPNISGIVKSLKTVYAHDDKDLEIFNLNNGRWTSVDWDARGPGAYRITRAGRHYFYKDEEERCYDCSFQLAKLLAARQKGYRLHRFNAEEGTFEAVIGCEPPGLFRRALIFCSGKLPEIRNNVVSYGNVPAEVGSVIMNKLYG